MCWIWSPTPYLAICVLIMATPKYLFSPFCRWNVLGKEGSSGRQVSCGSRWSRQKKNSCEKTNWLVMGQGKNMKTDIGHGWYDAMDGRSGRRRKKCWWQKWWKKKLLTWMRALQQHCPIYALWTSPTLLAHWETHKVFSPCNTNISSSASLPPTWLDVNSMFIVKVFTAFKRKILGFLFQPDFINL